MEALSHTDAAVFAERVRPVIDASPGFTSVLATNLDHALHGSGFPGHWFLIQDGEQPVGAAMYTPPYDLFLTPVPDAEAATTALAETVARAGLAPSGVYGPVAVVKAFLAAWRRRTGQDGRIIGTDRLYEIDSPPAGPDVTGAARPVTEADLELAAAWLHEFEVEVEHGPVTDDPQRIVRRRLARGHLLLWVSDDEPVSMAAISRPIAGAARIGAVFTPKEHRGKGFGSAVTAAATRQGFADGAERCLLYADLANPTSNHIYQAIGFRPVGDSARLTFAPRHIVTATL